MPDLPTLTVTASQAQRMLAVFGDVDSYKAWLRQQIVDHVLRDEQTRLQAEALENQRAVLAELRDELEAGVS